MTEGSLLNNHNFIDFVRDPGFFCASAVAHVFRSILSSALHSELEVNVVACNAFLGACPLTRNVDGGKGRLATCGLDSVKKNRVEVWLRRKL